MRVGVLRELEEYYTQIRGDRTSFGGPAVRHLKMLSRRRGGGIGVFA